MLIKDRLRQLRSDEGGFAMIVVIMVLVVGSIVAAAAVAASDNEILNSTQDKERKQAYAAAEAGIADYVSRLNADGEYWRNCGIDAGNASLNQRYTGSGTRKWATIPTTRSRYTVEALPANDGNSQCLTTNPEGTAIDTSTGTFRIRSTGQVGTTGIKRSIVATFRRRGFLDYVYFTDYEVANPEWSVLDAGGRPTRISSSNTQEIVTWAKENCVAYYRKGTRQNAHYNGQYRDTDNNWKNFNNAPDCGEIQFATGDKQNGPFHTNDEILVCETPSFGRSPKDDIEIVAPTKDASSGSNSGWRNCGAGAPQVNDPSATSPTATLGTLRKSATYVEIPPSNTELKADASPAYRFQGLTKLKLENDKIRVLEATKLTNGTAVAANTVLDWPKSGVVFVANDPNQTCTGYNPVLAVDAPLQPGCGDLWIQGNYTKSLTLGADNDILVRDDVTRTPSEDVLLGLIANQWVRVHHPVKNFSISPSGRNCDNDGGPMEITIEAAILAVNDSFTVDRYWCGAKLGDLIVKGAIAQRFRGPVGTGGGGGSGTGYMKNYNYDDRLRFRTPPKFIDPAQGSWRILTQAEQVPAT